MTALIVTIAVILLLAAILALPVRLTVSYRERVTLRLWILFFPLLLYPKKKKINRRGYSERDLRRKLRREARKAARAEKKRQKREKRRADHQKTPQTEPKSGTLWRNIILVRAILAALLQKTGKHLHLKAVRLHVRVATGDAATTAVLYGAVSASLALLLEALGGITRFRTAKSSVSVIADYPAERSSAHIKLVLRLRVWGALLLLLSSALTFLKEKKRNGDAEKGKAASEKSIQATVRKESCHVRTEK